MCIFSHLDLSPEVNNLINATVNTLVLISLKTWVGIYLKVEFLGYWFRTLVDIAKSLFKMILQIIIPPTVYLGSHWLLVRLRISVCIYLPFYVTSCVRLFILHLLVFRSCLYILDNHNLSVVHILYAFTPSIISSHTKGI